MVNINAEVTEAQKEIIQGKTYIIETAESVTTQNNSYEAIKVTLKSINEEDETVYATMLWQNETIPSNSKLGSFIDAFNTFLKDGNSGYDTDNWLGHIIKVKSWKAKDRQIEVIK